jgi:hypothetical protein
MPPIKKNVLHIHAIKLIRATKYSADTFRRRKWHPGVPIWNTFSVIANLNARNSFFD